MYSLGLLFLRWIIPKSTLLLPHDGGLALGFERDEKGIKLKKGDLQGDEERKGREGREDVGHIHRVSFFLSVLMNQGFTGRE